MPLFMRMPCCFRASAARVIRKARRFTFRYRCFRDMRRCAAIIRLMIWMRDAVLPDVYAA